MVSDGTNAFVTGHGANNGTGVVYSLPQGQLGSFQPATGPLALASGSLYVLEMEPNFRDLVGSGRCHRGIALG